MAMRTTAAKYKICATCVYWTGVRVPKGPSASFVDVDLDSEATCAPSGGRPYARTRGKGTCSKHVKWPALG